MSTDTAAVEAANDELYAAFEAGDLDRMAALWVGRRGRIHGEMRTSRLDESSAGIEPVLRSWALVMANAEDLQFIVTDVETVVRGDLATVTCTEIILRPSGGADPFTSSQAVATNGFLLVDGQWRMWLHHASPVMGAPEPGDDR